ncbi:MAG TPA: GAF domain-containing protein, partial [Fimbriimonadaceae bacterium]|nr:GAF domain-containing protein [Fimbriimonadaceae bacterium]
MLTPSLSFELVRRLIQTLTRAKDEDELLSELATELLRDSDADSVDILLRDDGEGLILRASTMSPEFVYRLKLGKGVGLCGEVMATGKPLMVRQGALKMPKYASYPGIDGRE